MAPPLNSLHSSAAPRPEILSYTAYGLGIHSVIPLPELVSSVATQDLFIHKDRVSLPADAVVLSERLRWAHNDVYLTVPSGILLIREGREIIVHAMPDADEQELRRFILGPAMGLLLHQRGVLALHASSVCMNGSAVLFLGGPGWGKSTMAATLHLRGHRVIADDITAIKVSESEAVVYPAFPQLKISAEAAASLGKSSTELPSIPGTGKHVCSVKETFSLQPLPMKRIYVLAESDQLRIDTPFLQEGVIELVRHSYCARLLPAIGASPHLLQCSQLIRHVPCRILRRPRVLSDLPKIAQMVEEDAAR